MTGGLNLIYPWIVAMGYLCHAAIDTGNWVSLVCLAVVALCSLDTTPEPPGVRTHPEREGTE